MEEEKGKGEKGRRGGAERGEEEEKIEEEEEEKEEENEEGKEERGQGGSKETKGIFLMERSSRENAGVANQVWEETQPGLLVCTSNASTWETEARGSQAQRQLGSHILRYFLKRIV